MAIVSDSEAAAYYNSRPKKRTGAGMLIRNHQGQLLIVKPAYLDRWLLPAGGIDEAESPLHAALRECHEEIGISFDATTVWPAYVNYLEPQPNGQDDIVQFVFTTDPVDDDFLSKLVLAEGEIEAAKFVDVEALPDYCSPQRATTIQTYCKYARGHRTLYLQNGLLVSGQPQE